MKPKQERDQVHLIDLLNDKEKYRDNTKLIKDEIKNGNNALVLEVHDQLGMILEDQNADPLSRLLAARVIFQSQIDQNIIKLVKDCMKLGNKIFINLVQNQQNGILGIIFSILSGQKDEEFQYYGKNYFNNCINKYNRKEPEVQKLGQSYIILLLECIYVWAIWFAQEDNMKPSQYLIAYKKLLDLKIEFPTELKYFEWDTDSQKFQKFDIKNMEYINQLFKNMEQEEKQNQSRKDIEFQIQEFDKLKQLTINFMLQSQIKKKLIFLEKSYNDYDRAFIALLAYLKQKQTMDDIQQKVQLYSEFTRKLLIQFDNYRNKTINEQTFNQTLKKILYDQRFHDSKEGRALQIQLPSVDSDNSSHKAKDSIQKPPKSNYSPLNKRISQLEQENYKAEDAIKEKNIIIEEKINIIKDRDIQIKQFNVQIEDLKEKIAQLQSENQNIKNQNQTIAQQESTGLQKLKKENDELQQEVDKLKDQIKAQKNDFEYQIQEIRMQNQELLRLSEIQNSQLSSFQKKESINTVLEKENLVLKQKVEDQQIEYQKNIMTRDQEINSLKQKLDEQLKKNEEKSKQTTPTKNIQNTTQNNILINELTVQDNQSQILQLHQQNEYLQHQLEKHQRSESDLEDTIRSYQQQLFERDLSISKMQEPKRIMQRDKRLRVSQHVLKIQPSFYSQQSRSSSQILEDAQQVQRTEFSAPKSEQNYYNFLSPKNFPGPQRHPLTKSTTTLHTSPSTSLNRGRPQMKMSQLFFQRVNSSSNKSSFYQQSENTPSNKFSQANELSQKHNTINNRDQLSQYYKNLPEDPKITVRFRKGILKNKFLIYDSPVIQIGILCDQLPHDFKQNFQIQIFFTNKSNQPIFNFVFQVIHSQKCKVKIKSNNLQKIMNPQSQFCMVWHVDYTDIPYDILVCELKFMYNIIFEIQLLLQERIPISNTINRYMEVINTTKIEFNRSWSECTKIYSSQEFDFDPVISHNIKEFLQKYFPFMVSLEMNSIRFAQKKISYGCQYFLRKLNLTIFFKIQICQSGQLIVLAGIHEEKDEAIQIAKFLVENMLLVMQKFSIL